MNELERKMVQQLQDLREHHHVVGVKAEFEAEGTRIEEAMRLKDVVSSAGLGLTMKVGGGEALRDMYEARTARRPARGQHRDHHGGREPGCDARTPRDRRARRGRPGSGRHDGIAGNVTRGHQSPGDPGHQPAGLPGVTGQGSRMRDGWRHRQGGAAVHARARRSDRPLRDPEGDLRLSAGARPECRSRHGIFEEDRTRIEMLEARYAQSIEQAGGMLE